jgi:formylglycine-generating enzyme required for sulfatase activity
MFEFFSAIAAALAVAGPVMENLGKIAHGGHRILEFADAVLARFRKNVPPDRQQVVIHQALEQAARMPPAEFDKAAWEIVDRALPDRSLEEKTAATEYLKLFPARIRSTFTRRDDPTGTTVPADFAVRDPRDILGLIPPRPPLFKEGDRPPGAPRWELVERLAIGGFGEVWMARSDSLRNTFRVFKFCLDPESQRYFFENESEIIELVQNELVDHPNIVKLLDAHLEGETPWLQYEYIPGGDLGQLIASWADDVAVRAAMAVQIGTTLAETLELCHNRIAVNGRPKMVIHRDMKPANVLYRNGTPKITDFGISNTQARQALDEARVGTVSGMTVSTPTGVLWASTPMYASDQQLSGERPHPADDVHALGVMLYQMILGDPHRPLNRDYIAVLERHHVCPELIAVVSRSIASDRPARFQHAGELADALRSLPKKLIVERSEPSAADREKQLYDEFDRRVADAGTKNEQARQLFDQRHWKQARTVMDQIFHPVLRDRELYKAVCLYSEGKRLKNSLGMEFAWVPPGDSWLGGGGGSPGSRKFTLEEGFWAGIYPVTQAEWQAVTGNTPSHFNGNPRFPVESVDWDVITNQFLPELNKKCQGDGYLYRLPTEDEWEYSCRGGPISQAQSAFHYYFARSKTDPVPNPTDELTPAMACFGQDSSSGKPSEVGSFLPNSLGIYDMHGNVWEWTAFAEGSSRVFRGGSWFNPAGGCTAASRNARARGSRSSNCVGFRLLAVPLVG